MRQACLVAHGAYATEVSWPSVATPTVQAAYASVCVCARNPCIASGEEYVSYVCLASRDVYAIRASHLQRAYR